MQSFAFVHNFTGTSKAILDIRGAVSCHPSFQLFWVTGENDGEEVDSPLMFFFLGLPSYLCFFWKFLYLCFFQTMLRSLQRCMRQSSVRKWSLQDGMTQGTTNQTEKCTNCLNRRVSETNASSGTSQTD